MTIDKRRFTRTGDRATSPDPPVGLKKVPHRSLLKLLAPAVRHVRVHLARRVDGAGPNDWRVWAVLKGLVENGVEFQRATAVLLAESQTPQMQVAAASLVRPLAETLGHLMLLSEMPPVVHAFERHYYREMYEDLRSQRSLFDSNAAYHDVLEQKKKHLDWLADKMALSERDARNPPRAWKFPGVGSYAEKVGGRGPLLSGNRRDAFRLVYLGSYRQLSWFVHQGLAAIIFPLTEEKHGQVPLFPSNLTARAMTLLAALLTEATDVASVTPPPTLGPLWEALLDLLEWSRQLYLVRYRALLEGCVLRDLGGA